MDEASTRLVLPVAELEGRAPGAHIDLMAPFLPVDAVDDGVLAELREFFAELTPFAFVLGEAADHPDGRRYLPPQPVAVFRRISHSLRRTFPEVVGPATSLDTVLPRLFLPEGAEVPTPLEVHAREARLLTGERTLAAFGFGTSAA